MRGLSEGQINEQKFLHAALDSGHITDWSIAVDGGAHVGGWTRIMAERFTAVHAFEPAPDTFQVLSENMIGVPNVRLHNLALMEARQSGTIDLNVRMTGRKFWPNDAGDIQAVAVDDFEFSSLGLLKLDLEGCDLFALKGARKTMKRCRPFVIVEMAASLNKGLSERFGVTDADVADWLSQRGYSERMRIGVNVGYSRA